MIKWQHANRSKHFNKCFKNWVFRASVNESSGGWIPAPPVPLPPVIDVLALSEVGLVVILGCWNVVGGGGSGIAVLEDAGGSGGWWDDEEGENDEIEERGGELDIEKKLTVQYKNSDYKYINVNKNWNKKGWTTKLNFGVGLENIQWTMTMFNFCFISTWFLFWWYRFSHWWLSWKIEIPVRFWMQNAKMLNQIILKAYSYHMFLFNIHTASLLFGLSCRRPGKIPFIGNIIAILNTSVRE